MTEIAKALTVAGTDPSGGAGIHADLKTFQEIGVYGMSVITSVVSQNTLGVKSFVDLELDFVESQFDAVFEDIAPDAVKSGMLSTPEVMASTAKKLKEANVAKYVLDPVMIASSGHALISETARETISKELLPLATVVTPNLPEAEALTNRTIKTIDDMKEAGRILVEGYGAKAALIKGGHYEGEADDYLYDGQTFEKFSAERFDTKHTHGSGCTYAAVITAGLANGKPLYEAVKDGKAYITAAISNPLNIGKGQGPTNHWGHRWSDVQSTIKV
ncbi:bifunctional hydroxymethylpyrimidine kinase/phosphomethylpyrimidine kinase [Salicibibacter halophilus]|uniref:Hydroxymethylpyrimidine/phosphomethylpyrimidine kinase n=1 Tax=Salicibibacter halophilus TaxID=2502791 RepID=A0A514LK77_9BACI|nr:bifunctional hydroxymethylpyrimidine kinase/phosphomethylpyrimidine kinase [Salicibibacter halophilus]QDI92268.1 bifunctional hydroxymethylpyrimidine kinase/phosphomethylpyrimidine kinase [Salicibibacter halophilus]